MYCNGSIFNETDFRSFKCTAWTLGCEGACEKHCASGTFLSVRYAISLFAQNGQKWLVFYSRALKKYSMEQYKKIRSKVVICLM